MICKKNDSDWGTNRSSLHGWRQNCRQEAWRRTDKAKVFLYILCESGWETATWHGRAMWPAGMMTQAFQSGSWQHLRASSASVKVIDEKKHWKRQFRSLKHSATKPWKIPRKEISRICTREDWASWDRLSVDTLVHHPLFVGWYCSITGKPSAP